MHTETLKDSHKTNITHIEAMELQLAVVLATVVQIFFVQTVAVNVWAATLSPAANI